MTRTQTPFDNFFLSSPASLCTSKTVFLLWEQNWQYVLRSNNFNLSLLTLPCLQRRNTQRGRSGTHPRENRSESVAPAIGVCTKSLQIAVGGIFEHKPLVVRWYPVRSTYLHAFSTPLRSCLEKTNSQNVGNTPAGKPKVVKKNTLRPSSSARKARWPGPAKQCSCRCWDRFSFLLLSFLLKSSDGNAKAQASILQFPWQ